jgi:hypothetical protein
MLRHPAIVAVVFSTVFIGCVFAAEPPASSAQPLANLLPRLGSDDFAIRQAAQKELDAVPATQLDALRKLAAAQTDPEIRSRLETRIDDILVHQVLDQPPLSLHVQHVPLSALCIQINAALGPPPRAGQWITTQTPDVDAQVWTLDIDRAPFWEVMRRAELGDVTPFNPGALLVAPHGGRVFNVGYVGVLASASAVGAPGVTTFGLNTRVFLDPRCPALLAAPIQWTDIRDDKGNALQVRPPGPIRDPAPLFQPLGKWRYDMLSLPDASARAVASAKGAVRITVPLGTQHLEIDDVEKHIKEPIMTGLGALTIVEIGPPDTGSIHLKIAPVPGVVPDTTFGLPPLLRVQFSGGKRSRPCDVTSSEEYLLFTVRDAGPVKLTIDGPAKIKEVTLPVELKDIPIDRIPPDAGGDI